MDVIEAEPLDLMVDRPGDDVARGQLGPLVELGHEAVAGLGNLELPALAAHRLGDQEVLDLQIVEAGRVELHEFHVGNPAARPPGHGDAVAGRALGRGREEIDPARAAGGEDRRPGGEGLDLPGRRVERIDAPDMAVARIALAMAGGDEVDRDHVGDHRDVGMGMRRLLQRLLDGPAGGVVDMDDPAVAVPALAGQVPALAVAVAGEGHAQLRQPRDRRRRVLDHELDRGAVVEAGAGDHRVLDMRLERVAGLEHRRDPALRPAGRALALGQHRHLEALREVERRRQPGRAGADDQDVVVLASHPCPWRG